MRAPRFRRPRPERANGSGLSALAGASGPLAVAAQLQIATFLGTGGAVTIDTDGAGPLFETPIAGPLPETLNFLP